MYPDKRILGIDPGLNGGFTVLNGDGDVYASDITPTVKVGKKEHLDGHRIVSMFEDFRPTLAIIEQVGARPGQGVTSMFSFGYGTGILEGILIAMRIPYRRVRPQEWMKEVLKGLPKVEKASVLFCQRQWPGTDWRGTERSKKPHDGKTDSACMAYYGLNKI